MGCQSYTLDLTTNVGPISVQLWDTAGQEKIGGLRDGYYVNCDVAFVFLDVCQKKSMTNTSIWISKLDRIVPEAKIVVCGNKMDQANKKVTDTMVILCFNSGNLLIKDI